MSKRLFEPQELSVRREERGSKGRVHQESVWHLGGGWVAEWGPKLGKQGQGFRSKCYCLFGRIQ